MREEEEAAADVFAALRKAVRDTKQLAFCGPPQPVSMSLGPASASEMPTMFGPKSDTGSSGYVTAEEASFFPQGLEDISSIFAKDIYSNRGMQAVSPKWKGSILQRDRKSVV